MIFLFKLKGFSNLQIYCYLINKTPHLICLVDFEFVALSLGAPFLITRTPRSRTGIDRSSSNEVRVEVCCDLSQLRCAWRASVESRRRIAQLFSGIDRVSSNEDRVEVCCDLSQLRCAWRASVESRRRIAVNYSVSQRSSDGNVITEHE
ncbi:hypothetical protein CEXT_592571 [Caerostris extrusa]|uniref:Uncharacterized protein n=1 Tax=Caerostris extrusa TaxID=172846 RepID=A0AAV4U7V3_CAEEX|nr:hypothetical protein CEXT_592571 [Caerostris extrusa]